MKALMAMIFLVLLTGLPAEAATVTASWTNATLNTDGTPLTGLEGTVVEWGTCTGTAFGTLVGSQTSATATATSLLTPNLPAGNYCFRAKHKANGGLFSVYTPTVVHVVLPAPPNPPTGLTTVTTVAYEQLWWGAMKQVGVVALNTPCGQKAPWPFGKKYAKLVGGSVEITGRYKGGALYGRCA